MRFTCPYLRCVAGGEAMLHDRWCGTPVHQGRNTPTLLQTLLEPQDGFGQEKLQAGGLAKSSWDGLGCTGSALSRSVVMMLTIVRRVSSSDLI